MVEIHLYGKLRNYAKDRQHMEDNVLWRDVDNGETLASVLDEMGIPCEEIKHTFINAKLLVARTSSGPLYGYLQARDTVFDWDLSLPLANGDRVGLFGLDLLVLGM